MPHVPRNEKKDVGTSKSDILLHLFDASLDYS